MAAGTRQPPPIRGWRYDAKSRGWYAPRFANLKDAQVGSRTTKSGRKLSTPGHWLSRRDYDASFGRLAKEGYSSYEAKATARKRAGIKRQPPTGGVKRRPRGDVTGIDRGANYLISRSLGRILATVAAVPEGWLVMPLAYGRAPTGEGGSGDPGKMSWLALGRTGDKHDWGSRTRWQANAARLFGDYHNVRLWMVRWRAPKG
jgi:hypothetical protein